jgi:hypothetical protein
VITLLACVAAEFLLVVKGKSLFLALTNLRLFAATLSMGIPVMPLLEQALK